MVTQRIEKLRTAMKENGVDIYYIPTSDPHKSEYIHPVWKAREYFSGFTGSAGFLIITKDEALLWADGRYYIQAEKEISPYRLKLMKFGLPETPTLEQWIATNNKKGAIIGYDPQIIMASEINNMKNILTDFVFKPVDLISEVWHDRPSLPSDKIYKLDVKYAGETVESKIQRICKRIDEAGADSFIATRLDDIAWILNLRGSDIKCNPVFMSYLFLDIKNQHNDSTNQQQYDFSAILFTNKKRVEIPSVKNVEVLDYEEIESYFENLPQSKLILVEKSYLNDRLYRIIENNIINGSNIVSSMKAIKNEVELENLRKCHNRDSVAMAKFLSWMDKNALAMDLTEIDAELKLEEFRQQNENYIGKSFDYISASGPNGAMMHYKAKQGSCSKILSNNFYLIDSGGQYFDGTTDITRTIPIGNLSFEMKKDYTLVVKSHIRLALAKFLYGTTGSKLDTIPRSVMWDNGKEYKCGTGHGVGFLLNVHEGPHGLTYKPNNVVVEENMILTNEPGIYKEGEYGIRIENTIVAKEWLKNSDGKFMQFETISYCPIDTRCILPELLSNDEIDWLNRYHDKCKAILTSELDENENKWLEKVTEKIVLQRLLQSEA